MKIINEIKNMSEKELVSLKLKIDVELRRRTKWQTALRGGIPLHNEIYQGI
jgi:hypothetical protein